MKSFYVNTILSLLFMISLSAQADILWRTNSLSYLKSLSEFEVLTNDDIHVFTFEHASGHTWGDTFMFIDRIDANADENNQSHKETYAEASARLSLNHAFGLTFDNALIKDTFIAAAWEFSTVSTPSFSRAFDNYLLGVGVSWNIPSLKYFNTNIFMVNNELKDNDTQLTVTWSYPIETDKHTIIFDGYIDWSSAEDDHAADFHFNPQIRLDVGRYFNKPNTIEVGVEYSYWHNKFGIRGIDDESVFSAMVKIFI